MLVLFAVAIAVLLGAVAPAPAQGFEPVPQLCVFLPPVGPIQPDYIVSQGGPIPTIQDALAAAIDTNGDGRLVICVDPGQYPGGIVVDESALGGLDVLIFGVRGADQTVITSLQPPVADRGIDIVGLNSWGPLGTPTGWAVDLKELTIRDFNIPTAPFGPPYFDRSGGAAVRAKRTVLTMGGVKALSNWAEGPGGALSIQDSWVELDETTLSSNSSGTWGGGAYIDGRSGFRMVLGTVSANFAPDAGGGIYLACDCQPVEFPPAGYSGPGYGGEIIDSTFQGNSAAVGGGVFADWVGRLDVTGTRFEGNEAVGPLIGGFGADENSGGGLFAADLIGAVGGGDGLVLDRCDFVGNRADSRGGAVALFGHDHRSAHRPAARCRPSLENHWTWGLFALDRRPPLGGRMTEAHSSTHGRTARLVLTS